MEVSLCGLSLKNPLILASGILGVSAKTMIRVDSAGAGAIVTKSIGKEPREGHTSPSLIELNHGLLNAMGLPNPGIKNFVDELESLRGRGMVIVGSVFGKNEDEFAYVARRMEEAGAKAVELNLSCPHAKGLGMELGSDPVLVKKIVQKVKLTVDIPVWAKLTPHVPDIVEIGSSAVSGGADALVAINTMKAMRINTDAARPVLGNKAGGLSGAALKPVGIRAVYDLASNLEVPVVGVGGIMRGEDAAEYMMAGASAVQVGSAVFYHGIEAFGKIKRELAEFMEQHGYKDINEIIGIALRK